MLVIFNLCKIISKINFYDCLLLEQTLLNLKKQFTSHVLTKDIYRSLHVLNLKVLAKTNLCKVES